MMMYAIDGACRRNGKPDCTSSGGVFCFANIDGKPMCKTMNAYEYNSTNQRGELSALLVAIRDVFKSKDTYNFDTTYIITDSEYIFNAMTKQWYATWYHKNWMTASGSPVKNSDIWGDIYRAMLDLNEAGIEPIFYHIKGHCIPFGRVTADNLLDKDTSGGLLFKEVLKKYDSCKDDKKDKLEAAQQLSERNNGFRLPDDILRRLVVCNTVADAVATKIVDEADARRKG